QARPRERARLRDPLRAGRREGSARAARTSRGRAMTAERDELFVVAAERQVEILAGRGARAETRRRLEERLAASLLQNARFAGPVARRAALAMALPAALEGDRRADELRRSALGWERTLDAIDDALGVLRARGASARELGAAEREEPIAAVLRRAMNALDARLARAGLVDD